MNFLARAKRHVRLTLQNHNLGEQLGGRPAPPFLILFINSICNQTCEHCFYWRNLNRKDDLSVDELRRLSGELGTVETLNLSGGEPFLRTEFAEICRFFIRKNGVKQIYVPTNGSFPDRTVAAVEEVLREPSLQLFAVELSLDGMPEYHDRFRGMKNAFVRSMETYRALSELQRRDPRLRIHAISTATRENMGEISELTRYLYENCPAMDHHNLALIRGDRKNPSLQGPTLDSYRELYQYVQSVWAPREEQRFGSIVEPMLQWAKTETAVSQRQVVPCRAGRLSAVVYANGDVSFCESHPPIGNLRETSFTELWKSAGADALRASIDARACWCTNEVFLWPSIVFQPVQLARAFVQSGAWKKPPERPEPPAPRPVDDLVQIR